MRRWQSHKQVQAEPILAFYYKANQGPVAMLSQGEEVPVPFGFDARGTPEPGDYLVVYEDGYMSWSPRAAFEDGYEEIGFDAGDSGLDFGEALTALQDGLHVARDEWEMGVFIVLGVLVPGHEPFIALRTPTATYPWTPTHLDLLADDWRVVE